MLEEVSLWGHQRSAIEMVLRYLRAFKTGRTQGAALVHMPTGSGKSGVIAALARCIPQIGGVLLLSPRRALCDQLYRDVSGRLFAHLARKPSRIAKSVVRLGNVQNGADKVFIATIQKLDSMRRRRPEEYTRLSRAITLLMFDEGHYEPAPVWRDAVRGIERPRVIFTATPYRNDFKLFDVDFAHVSSYSFGEAVRDRFVRTVEIVQATPTRSISQFVDDIIRFYDGHSRGRARTGKDAPRMIIRCESPNSIRQICSALVRAGRTCIGIHERFSDQSLNNVERRSVPDPETCEAIFWVHQFKLLEGIDDPRFELLAVYDELRSVRTLVQQVGRIIRNPSRTRGAVAHVLDHSEGRQASLWQNYLGYDALVRSQGIDVLEKGQAALLDAVRAAQPAVVYVGGRFRTPTDPDRVDPKRDLQLPLTVNVLRREADFELDDAVAACRRGHTEADRIVRSQVVEDGVGVLVYVAMRNSPFLRDGAFLEHRLGVTVVRQLESYVCYLDSGGVVPPAGVGIGKPVSVKGLRKLFQRRQGGYLTAVALRNANLGASMVRTRAISAVDVGSTVPGFDDHAFVCSTAAGYGFRGGAGKSKGRRVRRYVGFGTGKVSDLVGKAVPFQEYLAWLEEIRDIVSGSVESVPAFRRYAMPTETPGDPEPVNILLDVADIQDRYLSVGGEGAAEGQPMELDDLCRDVVDGQFGLTANGQPYSVEITFDAERSRYVLAAPELAAAYYSPDGEMKESVVQYLNGSQSMRVIPKSSGVFYTEGEFYKPLIRFGAEYDDSKTDLLETLRAVAELAAIGSEKGSVCQARGAGWEVGCLFNLVDVLGLGSGLAGYFTGAEALVCDDMGDESADFILLRRDGGAAGKRTVAFIHAKAKADRSLFSASDLQDVCSQAVKNLGELALFGDSRADKRRKWRDRWTSGQVRGHVRQRVRHAASPATVWEEIRRVIRDPSADREVWLVLGRILSKTAFEREIRRDRPHSAAIQAAYLLSSTLTTTAAAGARLRVFCSP
jgi:hypothetical protein